MTLQEDNRNPWKGISLWREFVYDMRHFGKMHRRATVNLKSMGLNWWILLLILVGAALWLIPDLVVSNPVIQRPK